MDGSRREPLHQRCAGAIGTWSGASAGERNGFEKLGQSQLADLCHQPWRTENAQQWRSPLKPTQATQNTDFLSKNPRWFGGFRVAVPLAEGAMTPEGQQHGICCWVVDVRCLQKNGNTKP